MKYHFFILIFLFGIMSSYAQPTDYLGFWPLDGNANDQSSNALHGTISGAISSQGHDGSSNSAMYFDGVNDYIVVPYSSILQPGYGSFSVSFWMKPGTKSGVRVIDGRGSGSGGSYNGFHFKYNTSGSDWYIYDAGVDDATGNYKHCGACGDLYSCFEWHHVVMVYDADSELRFYVDGSLDGIASVGNYGSLSNALPLGFGAAVSSTSTHNPPSSVSQNFEGYLDEVYMFDRVLSETEVGWLAERLTVSFDYDNAGNRIERTITLSSGAGAKSSLVIHQPVIEDSIQIAQINLFPNPTEGEVFLQIEQEEEILRASINVFNTSGSIIFSRKIYDIEERIDLSEQSPGTYLIVVNINDQQYVWRVIKE